jgi:Fanconi anemia group M protein
MVFSKDKDDTISIIKNIWLRMMETGMKTVIRYKPRLVSDDDYKLFIIQGLPNIGPRLADRLLKKFRTVRKVFTSNMYDLKDVEGIGERKAREIIRIITEPYKGKS